MELAEGQRRGRKGFIAGEVDFFLEIAVAPVAEPQAAVCVDGGETCQASADLHEAAGDLAILFGQRCETRELRGVV
jgi:hypothetical protein